MALTKKAKNIHGKFDHSVGLLIEDFDKKLELIAENVIDIRTTVHEHTEILKTHSEMLQTHSEMLQTHSEVLQTHSEVLETHGTVLERIEAKLDGKVDKKDHLKLEKRLVVLEKNK